MGSARTHSLSSIALLAFGILFLGFGAGFLTTDLLLSRVGKNSFLQLSAGGVRAKRMSAIKKAIEKGKNEYEFEVSGFRPILK